MSRSIKTLVPIIIIGINGIFPQTFSILDTITILPGESQFNLTHPFIIDTTFQLFHKGLWVEHYSLDPIDGVVRLPYEVEKEATYISSYQYLVNSIPKKVGPLLLKLPPLDSLVNNRSDSTELQSVPELPEQDGDSELFTTGTIFRNIDISPYGGTDFSGGLRLQLQGNLAEDIQVSGVLTDQNWPIQPEGNTQALEEIDNIYLQVTHPQFQITAGDIDYNVSYGNYLNINRKLIGLKNSFNGGSWSGKAVYAGSKGRYNQLELKGADGNQGPYFLTSNSDSRDIVVLAGSERVWLDGKSMLRGENHDYVIDYSSGEITFTPRHIIHIDSDIYIEYQYSDFQYGKNVLGASVRRKYKESNSLTISWLKEFDLVTDDSFVKSGPLRDSLRVAGDRVTHFSGVKVDPDGDYLLKDTIYVYSPDISDTSVTRYIVTFQNDPLNGSYAKRVANAGKLYYEFIPKQLRRNYQDLYSPWRRIISPESQSIMQIMSAISLTKKVKLTMELAFSDLDKNTISNLDDRDNRGLAYHLELNGTEVALRRDLRMHYRVLNWSRSSRFHSLQREREVLFNRDWNLSSTPLGKEQLTKGEISFLIPNFGKTMVDWSHYTNNSDERDRFQSEISGKTHYIPELEATYSQVLFQDKMFIQSDWYGSFLPGKFRPFLAYRGESETQDHRFDHGTFGFVWDGSSNKTRVGIGKRVDWLEFDSTKAGFERLSEGFFGEFDQTSKSKSGWSRDIVLRKRIKTNYHTNQSFDYELAKVKLNFFSPTNPLRWDLQTKIEETYSETRVIVYDSVGVGLGQYRKDLEFNEYVSDPNGAYIAYTVLTGDRRPTTHFESTQRLNIDFSKSSLQSLQSITLRLEFRNDFKGQSFGLSELLIPDIKDTNITRSRWNFRNEIDYNPRRSTRRLRNWVLIIRDLEGFDPRGNDLRNQVEVGLEWREPLKRQWQLLNSITVHSLGVESEFSELRERTVEGGWLESGVKWRIDQEWQIDVFLQGGRDVGSHRQSSFKAHSEGLRFEILRFLGKTGRIQTRIEWHISQSDQKGTTLPPEALHGLTIGKSFKMHLLGHVLLGNNLSLNTTLSYVNNIRYRNLITLTGELRAYF